MLMLKKEKTRISKHDVLYALECIFFMFVMVPVFVTTAWIILDFIDFIVR
jgi:hypothetical protein